MTPAARHAAAIDVLDRIAGGVRAEKALSDWGRQNRFAGSKDRAALRDHVFDVLRAKRSLGRLGGGDSGRALILGLLRRDGIAPDSVFGAGGYAPPPLTAEEAKAAPSDPAPLPVQADLPDWLWPLWQDSLGDTALETAQLATRRGPFCLRVNLRRGSRTDAVAALAEDGIPTTPHPDCPTALLVTAQPRRVAQSRALQTGLVEVQDASSQIAMARLTLPSGARVLDYCAGGGGKALALADIHDAQVTAHDADPARMGDIAPRAARAGVSIATCSTADLPGFAAADLVLVDAPCSGSGTWRRNPEAKWRLTPDDLADFAALQGRLLDRASAHVAPGGRLAYATCSVLSAENDAVCVGFLARNSGWVRTDGIQLEINARYDGFFLSVFQRSS